MTDLVQKYAKLLVNYCLEIRQGDRLLVQSTILAEPLVREVFRLATRAGAHVLTDLEWREQQRIYYKESNRHQLEWLSPVQEQVFQHFEAYLHIRAPYNLREDHDIDLDKRKVRSQATIEIHEIYNKRTATRDLKRCLCQFPTQAAAQEAGMSLEEYEEFVYHACRIYDADPQVSWLKVRKTQQRFVDYLNQVDIIQFHKEGTDLRIRVKDRIWMNSDGQTNMPSGEVYTAPHEDGVDGVISFDHPSVFRGRLVEGITLEVRKGKIMRWEAKTGQTVLDEIFAYEGTRRFGEVAVGTNYNIRIPTRNILFDEKIGGTIHMAIGQSYYQTGGKNSSPIHWDMISDMLNGGEIRADGELIYRNGQFLI